MFLLKDGAHQNSSCMRTSERPRYMSTASIPVTLSPLMLALLPESEKWEREKCWSQWASYTRTTVLVATASVGWYYWFLGNGGLRGNTLNSADHSCMEPWWCLWRHVCHSCHQAVSQSSVMLKLCAGHQLSWGKRHYSDKISNFVSSDFHLSLAIKNFKRHVALRDKKLCRL